MFSFKDEGVTEKTLYAVWEPVELKNSYITLYVKYSSKLSDALHGNEALRDNVESIIKWSSKIDVTIAGTPQGSQSQTLVTYTDIIHYLNQLSSSGSEKGLYIYLSNVQLPTNKYSDHIANATIEFSDYYKNYLAQLVNLNPTDIDFQIECYLPN